MSLTRQSVIITFKVKDQRANKKKDKLDILRSEISSPGTFLAAANLATGLPSGVAAMVMGV
jgi:hypothetical protein